MNQVRDASTAAGIGERLRQERLRLALTQTDMADLAGVSKSSQILYEKGERSPDALYLEQLHRQGVDVMHILTGRPRNGEQGVLTVQVPVEWLRPGATALDDAPADERDLIQLPRSWFARRSLLPANVRLVEVKSLGMAGVLDEGSIAVVDTSDVRPRSGQVYAMRQGDELLFRYLTPMPGGLVRVAGTTQQVPQYDVQLSEAKDVTVLGRVVALMRDL